MSLEAVVARFADNLAKIVSRYELPLAQLVRLNPGMHLLASLAVDTPMRLLQPARTRMS
ncbi:MAG: peptidoglycan-binding protein, partial [Synechococcaceae bacterium WB9_2_170]|nr:peptidoglycan-binding protein [Synechococcaceae bacterium WB9_2_170]